MYAGPWVHVQKPPSSTTRITQGLPAVTKIHDDEDAKALGFKAGIVGGLTLEGVTAAKITGRSWGQSRLAIVCITQHSHQ